MKQLIAPLTIAAAGASLYLSDAPLQAPWSGMTLATTGCALVAIGFTGKSPWAVLVAIVAVEAPVAVYYLASDPSEPVPCSDDPGCGLPLGAAMLILLPFPVMLATAGWVARALVDRLRRDSDAAQHPPMS